MGFLNGLRGGTLLSAPRKSAWLFFVMVCAVSLPLARSIADESGGDPMPPPSPTAGASAVPVYAEYDKKVRAAEQVAPLTSDLFGDSVAPYLGQTEFNQVDIDLPGNDTLPVQLRRRFVVSSLTKDMLRDEKGGMGNPYGGAGNWDVDVPYIAGVFDSGYKWDRPNGVPGQQGRCSTVFTPGTQPGYSQDDVLSGAKIHLPGEGDLSLMALSPDWPPVHAAADGQTHLWTTRRFDSFTCTPIKNGAYGEGFVMTTPEGTKYFFDVYAWRQYASVTRRLDDNLIVPNGRVMIFLLASKVVDRFGNTVTYTYDGNDHPIQIAASDGRKITLTYDPSHPSQLTSASVTLSVPAQTRTWSYAYAYDTDGYPQLSTVTRPDNSTWTFTYSNKSYLYVHYSDPDTSGQDCADAPVDATSFTLEMTHPAGSKGTFEFLLKRHQRTLPTNPPNCSQGHYNVPPYVDAFSLVSKTISESANTSKTWSYTYGNGADTCVGCFAIKKNVVTQPDGSLVRSTYSTMYNATGFYAPAGTNIEGQLLQTDVLSGPNGAVLRSTVNTYVPGKDVQSQPHPGGFPSRYGVIWGPGDPSAGSLRPLKNVTITQAGATFTRTHDTFDPFARPLKVTRSSSLGNPSAQTAAYKDYLDLWVLGLTASITDTSLPNTPVVQNVYDSLGNLLNVTEFGRLTRAMTYRADGTLASVSDGANRTTTLGVFKRGIPQSVSYPDGSSQSAVIDDAGSIRSVTNEVGATTQYDIDSMGRVTSITYPGNRWNSTTITYVPTTLGDMGVSGSHWRQTTTTGNAQKIVEYDARWRPVMTKEMDTANPLQTTRMTLHRYDYANRETYASYPYSPADVGKSPLPGVTTTYDALGQTLSISSDSEISTVPLTTAIAYEAPFVKKVTDPKGFVTTTTFMAWDTPTEEMPASIISAYGMPEAQTTNIARDAFGKPLSVTRTGTYQGATVAQTRTYVYDANQRLCLTTEPEVGATVQDYDAADRVIWRARSTRLNTLTTCNRSSVLASEKVSFSYDARNRLTGTSYPDATSPLTQTYERDGLLKTTSTNDATWTYTYNSRRLPESESLSYDGQTFPIGRAYDANGALSQLRYPDDATVDFQPNALGQPTKAGTYATSVSYFPNGAINSFIYGNGITHTLTQNSRKLPARSRDGTVVDLSYTYDKNANVASITDGAWTGADNRVMGYDALNRLTSTALPDYAASYTYDPFDNLRTSAVGTRTCAHSYGVSTNRLSSISGANCPTIAYGYDVRGNTTQRGSDMFTYDFADRMSAAVGKENYAYDGLGHRVRMLGAGGAKTYQIYSKDGQLLYSLDADSGATTRYVYLNGSLVARNETLGSLTGPVAPTGLTVAPNPSPDGTYTVSWDGAPGVSRYVLKEQANGGAETTAYDGENPSWAATGKAIGTYVYRVQACNPVCGDWSETVTEIVQPPPGAIASITATPNPSTDGGFRVDWSNVPATIAYLLEEQIDGGDWRVVQSDWPTTWSTSGRPNGTYRYRARAWNLSGYGPYSAVLTVPVQIAGPPPPAWIKAEPGPITTSSTYLVSWAVVTNATGYQLEQRIGSSTTWSPVYNGTSTSWQATNQSAGVYRYRARAKNGTILGAPTSEWVQTVQAAPPAIPLPPTILLSSDTSTDGRYTVSWNAPDRATSYELWEKYRYGVNNEFGDAAFSRIVASGSRVWSPNPPKTGYGNYYYQAKACNVSGCSGPSDMVVVKVRLPNVIPGVPANVAVAPNPSTTGNYTVTWTATPNAARYFVKERVPSDAPVWIEVTPPGGTTNTQWSTPTPRANGKYQFSVKACNDYGCSDESTLTQTVQVTVQIPAPTPATPTGFSGWTEAQAGHPIRFFWRPVAGADRYELEETLTTCRRENDPRYFQFAANAQPPYTRGAALAKCAGQEQDPSTYQYVIRACNGSNCSAWSTDVVTTTVNGSAAGPESTTTTTFIHTDGLRSPVAETTAGGAVKTRVRYEPYGATRLPAAQGPGYAGHVTDEKTGLSYMQQRYYDPIAGRFLSIDPVAADAGSFNRYWYANNNPYRNIDPDGRQPIQMGYGTALQEEAKKQLAGQLAEGLETLDREVLAPMGPAGLPEKMVVLPAIKVLANFAAETKAVTSLARSVDRLSEAAGVADRGGLTAAGRALQKHGSREGSAFPKATGNPNSINRQAQDMVDDILTNPGSEAINRHHARFGDVTEVRAPDGRGVRYGPDVQFLGFLEPNP
jgi:RHS repeat-associated protein